MRTSTKTWIALLLLVVIAFIGSQNRSTSTESIDLSVVQLLSTPRLFDGQRVCSEGYLHVRFEDFALYLNKESGDYLMDSNAIWVSFTQSPRVMRQDGGGNDSRRIDQLDNTFVQLCGVFSVDEHGHLGSFPGALIDVDRIVELTPENRR